MPVSRSELRGKVLSAAYPTVLNGLLPALAVFADTDNDVEAVVTGVETLSVALRAVADQGEGVIFEVILELSQRPVGALVDDFLGTGKVEGLDTARCLSWRLTQFIAITL